MTTSLGLGPCLQIRRPNPLLLVFPYFSVQSAAENKTPKIIFNFSAIYLEVLV